MTRRARIVARAGRVVFWLLAGTLLLVALSTLARGGSSSARSVVKVERRAPAWPSDRARAVAEAFTYAYLSWDPAHPVAYRNRLRRWVPDEATADVTPSFARHAPAVHVTQVDATDMRADGADAAVVTVRAILADGTECYLAVPVRRGANGFGVAEAPSLVAHDESRMIDTPAYDALPNAERVEIFAVLDRFLRAYVNGDLSQALGDVQPGYRMRVLDTGLTFRGLNEINLASSRTRVRIVVADVTVDDHGARRTLRYRVRLARGDRWFVQAVNEGGS